MASYPTVPNKYPGNPNGYPGSGLKKYPSGGSFYPSTAQIQPAGARIGQFSAANNFSDTTAGQGPELALGTTLVVAFWRDNGTTNNQYLWGFNTLTTGWFILLGNARNIFLFLRGAGSTGFGNVYFGLNVLVITRTSGNTYRWSMNGGVTQAMTSPGSYVAAGASARHCIGYNVVEAAFPGTQHSVIWQAFINAGLNDADCQTISGQANALDRWHAPTLVTSHANLTWFANWENWDGSSSTFTGTGNGGGASPYTMTKAGTVPKTVLPSYLRYQIPESAIWDAQPTVTQGVTGQSGLVRRNPFSVARFTSSANDTTGGPGGLVVESDVAVWNFTGNIIAGVAVNGTNLACNNNGANPIPGIVQTSGYGLKRAVDCPGIPAGTGKTFEVTASLLSLVSTTVCSASTPTHVRVPASTPITWLNKTAPANQVINLIDSLGQEQEGVTEVSAVKGPVYEAWPMLERKNFASSRVACEGWGFGTWAERINTSGKRSATLALLQNLAIGTSQNLFWMMLGTNDYGTNTYASLATFESDLTAFMNALIALNLPGFKAWLASPTTRSDTVETNNNPSGWNLPNLRTSISNVVTALANANVIYVDTSDNGVLDSGWVIAANRTDGLHYNTAGHSGYEVKMRAVVGY
jgi:lysophospholipase L1-like esterase